MSFKIKNLSKSINNNIKKTLISEVNMAQNVNVRMPPFLPTVPLPVNLVGQGMMYMYSCSQCDFKTHVEAMFKQHVDSVHLGIPRYIYPNYSLII